MICHEHRCIYIVMHKAASTSILAAFGVTNATRQNQRFNQGPRQRSWPFRPRSYFVFSSIRNPFDRAVSAWAYLQGRAESALRGLSLEEALSQETYRHFDHGHFVRTQVDRLSEGGKLVTSDLVRVERLQADFDRICDRIEKPRAPVARLNAAAHGHYRDVISADARRLIEQRFARDFEEFGYDW